MFHKNKSIFRHGYSFHPTLSIILTRLTDTRQSVAHLDSVMQIFDFINFNLVFNNTVPRACIGRKTASAIEAWPNLRQLNSSK
jgi:hypothetical protein